MKIKRYNASGQWDVSVDTDKIIPAGTISSTIAVNAPSGWLFLQGQTVANASTTYPDLWSVVPAAWKSGSSLVLPDMTDAALVQTGGSAAAVGALGGSMTTTIASGNLPTHTHAIDHDHASFTSGAGSAHNHGITDPGHTHNDSSATGDWLMTDITASVGLLDVHDGGSSLGYSTTAATASATTGITTNNESAHTHSIDVPNFTGNSGNGGFANTAMTTRPRHLGVNVMIKAH